MSLSLLAGPLRSPDEHSCNRPACWRHSSWCPRPRSRPLQDGAVLFTCARPWRRDVPGTLKRVADLGYEEVEMYWLSTIGRCGMLLHGGGRLPQAAARSQQAHHVQRPLRSEPLRRVSPRRSGALRRPLHRGRDRALGQSYITWPWLDEQSRTIEKFKVVAERLNIAGKRIVVTQACNWPITTMTSSSSSKGGGSATTSSPTTTRCKPGQAADGAVLDREGVRPHASSVVRKVSPAGS